MTGRQWLRLAMILLGAPLAAVGLNVLAFSLDQKLQQHHPVILILVVFSFGILGLALYWMLHLATSDNVIAVILIVFWGWVAAPPLVALSLWGRLSARTWTVVAWHWALDPLPIEIEKLFGWTVPKPSLSLPEGLMMILLQLATLGLVVGAVGVLIRRLSAGDGASRQ